MDKEKIKSIFWDYDVDYSGEELYNFMIGNKEIDELPRNRIIARMLTSLRWYDLVDIFGLPQLYKFLNDDVFKFIWKKSLKTRFKNVRETLQHVL